MEKEFKIGDKVIAEDGYGKYLCEITDIVDDEGVIFYELNPVEFSSFTRYFKADALRKV